MLPLLLLLAVASRFVEPCKEGKSTAVYTKGDRLMFGRPVFKATETKKPTEIVVLKSFPEGADKVNQQKSLHDKFKGFPFINQAIECYKGDNTLVLEYVDGHDMENCATLFVESYDIFRSYAAQLMVIMDKLKEKKVIHKDLKLQSKGNIMLNGADGNLVLIDLGNSKTSEDVKLYMKDWQDAAGVLLKMLHRFELTHSGGETDYELYNKALEGLEDTHTASNVLETNMENVKDFLKKLLTTDEKEFKKFAASYKTHKIFEGIDFDKHKLKESTGPKTYILYKSLGKDMCG